MILPSIPDNSYKILLYIGLIFIGYGFLQSISLMKAYNEEVDNLNSFNDTLVIAEKIQDRERQELINISSDLSKRYNITNPISDTDTSTVFNKTLRGEKDEMFVTDTLQSIWRKFIRGNFEKDILTEKISMTKTNLENLEDEYKYENYFYYGLAIIGLLISCAGFVGMVNYQMLQEKLISLEIEQKEIKFRHCQSCGKNFSTLLKRGKESNGEINNAFCFNCYENGQFTEPELTVQEFKDRTKSIIDKRKLKREREKLQKRFDNLERWNTDEYT